MKTILTALVTLSVIAGAAAPSFATSPVNAKKVFDQLDKQGRGGHNN